MWAKRALCLTLFMMFLFQGEQLRRVEEGLDDINIGIRDAETHIEDMEKCCGLCILPWKRFRKFETTAVYK